MFEVLLSVLCFMTVFIDFLDDVTNVCCKQLGDKSLIALETALSGGDMTDLKVCVHSSCDTE